MKWRFCLWVVAFFAPSLAASAQVGPFSVEGEQTGAELGRVLATGDFDGDGFGDLVVAAPQFDHNGRVDRGRVTVHFGSANELAPSPGWTALGERARDHFGSALATGDMNGDGYDDLVVSAPEYDRTPARAIGMAVLGHNLWTSDEGRTYVFLGSAAGLAVVPQRRFTGVEIGARAGAALACPGDVNGDGFDELLMGAPGTLGGIGTVHLFSGSESGVSSTAWTRHGENAGEGFASVVAGAGDLDGDGHDDFFLPVQSRNGLCGLTEVFLGSPTGPEDTPDLVIDDVVISVMGPSFDIDQDGTIETVYADHVCGGGAVDWRYVLEGSLGGYLPLPSLASALTWGDWNGDGRLDVFAGVTFFAFGPHHGGVWGYTTLPGQAFPAATNFPMFYGDQAGADWGAALAMIDVDGDGADELFIGAPLQDEGETDEGLVVLVAGRKAELELSPSSPAIPLPSGVATSGNFDGDAFSDILVSAGSNLSQELEVRYGTAAGLPSASDDTLNRPTFPGFDGLVIQLTSGDFDGDGFTDVVASFTATILFGPMEIEHHLYLGSSSGLASDAAVVMTGPPFAATNVGDVNGDGRDDVSMDRETSVDIHFGTSSGLDVTPSQVFTGSASGNGKRILAGNLNGDVYRDVVIRRGSGTQVSLMLGSPAGLVLQQVQTDLPFGPTCVALADVSGDGRDDLLFRSGLFANKTYLGTPTGFVRAEQWWEYPLEPGNDNPFFYYPIESLFDADQDGYVDLLFEGHRLHRGTAQGIERSPIWTGLTSRSIPGLDPPAGDFDGDGRLELFVDVVGATTWQALEVDEL